MNEFVTPAEFVAYVEGRGYKAERLYNTAEAEMDGAPLRIMGYTMRGPRGYKRVVSKTAEGLLPMSDARLYCDSWDYGTKHLRRVGL